MRYWTIYILLSISSGDQYTTNIWIYWDKNKSDKEAGKAARLYPTCSVHVTPMTSRALQGKGSDIDKCIHVAITISGALQGKGSDQNNCRH